MDNKIKVSQFSFVLLINIFNKIPFVIRAESNRVRLFYLSSFVRIYMRCFWYCPMEYDNMNTSKRRSCFEEQVVDVPMNVDALTSPPNGAESLFFDGLDNLSNGAATSSEQQETNNNRTSTSCQEQLQQQQQQRSVHSVCSMTKGSIGLDDFMSCIENDSDYETDDSFDTATISSPVIIRSPYSLATIIDSNKTDLNSNNIRQIMASAETKTKRMAAKTTTITKDSSVDKPHAVSIDTTGTTTTPVATTLVADEAMKVDAAEIVYGKAKDIFSWGKTVPVVSFFVKTGAAVAGKALDVVGTDLSTVDGKIESELTKLDGNILNPTINAIAKVLINIAGKSEETIKPIIIAILSPLGMIKSEENESTPKAHVITPDVSVTKYI
mmetsp:Transcript_39673/g.44676  ORF Transcript_39673/g.44676 Transcript_39673/m.44676 type:complete len:382 (-) Transcript_39673:13-1158(-)